MKILSAETNLGSATNVSNATVVRLFNSGTDNILVTRKDYGGTTVGSFIVPAGQVVYGEKYFTDTLEGSSDVKATKVAYSSMMSFVGQTDTGPSYTYSVSASNVDEGGNWTTTVTTTNVDDNTTLYWELSGTGITSADFSSGALTGSGTISNNTFNFSHTVANDTLTEGTETVTLKLYTDSGRNTQVGNEVTVTLNDTSTTPPMRSVYMDGDESYLTVAAGNHFNIGTSLFTFEGWYYANTTKSASHFKRLFDLGDNSNLNDGLSLSVDSNDRLTWRYNDVAKGYSDTDFPLNQWVHVAAVRTESNRLLLFQNGTEVADIQDAFDGNTNLTQFASDTLHIGANHLRPHYSSWNGWISNFRYTLGTAVYTSNFTVPTSGLESTTNTRILCCNGATVTSSTTAFGTISTVGELTAVTPTPFDGNANILTGQFLHTKITGNSDWVCPPGVTSVCVVCIGAGAPATDGGGRGRGGAGGGLGYKNNISVTPGNTYTLDLDSGASDGGKTTFISASTVRGSGGDGTTGGGYVGDGGGNGGSSTSGIPGLAEGGGGGAGGYSGNGGNAGQYVQGSGYQNRTDGSGGAGAGGAGVGGGGVGAKGEGSSGTGNGAAGSGGSNGSNPKGGRFGGGSLSDYYDGGDAALRIMWGSGRSYPSTRTADE